MPYKVIINSTQVKFSASHFLKEPFKCSRLHGHNYYVTVELSSELDENYFVVDFIELKKKVKSIIKPIDHCVLIPKLSQDLEIYEDKDSIEIITRTKKRYVFPKSDTMFLPLRATTSELLAKYIHGKVKEIYPNKHIKVILEESKSTMASYED
ncbi:MAG: 6-carboxytetrahydropterin synthase [Candidatus Lokiarchaeota archaeon]|nr:6-carboxytetrahydropterin synthase [Candidatus Lokiarchaeota archaeon]